ncbi:hypothetical protein GYMLUDRAFT_75271 [Collybiopsis luxurians FD-317 M1]|uniref:Uncharacterized protein n=1 Tax=Collybiopsis luxurians FD-317 M1 TaxID=944289 RepID=A0A0D0BR19_9AGAR|nr:hypothetical protein GYMLUDRAFT_75271 [Collybiopsis luxurians FD-317 M1]
MVQIMSSLFATTGVLALFLGCVRSQTVTLASCDASTGFSWSYNSLDQDPCTVATYLGGVCNSGQYTIPAINSTQFYSGPSSTAQNECRCSTVLYSLLMACAECQGATTINWSSYSQSCSTVYTGIFLDTIPSGTKVPNWAYQNVTSGGFNATLAQLTGDSPESTGAATATSSSVSSSPALASGSSATNSPSTQTGASKSSKSNAGVIAGSVVGGVIGLALIIAALFWFLRRRSRSTRSRNIEAARPPVLGHGNDRLSPDMTGTTHAQTIIPFPPVQQKLYSPDDPSTFPPNVASPTTTHAPYSSVQDVGSVYNHSSNPSYGGTHTGPQQTYSGYAEI